MSNQKQTKRLGNSGLPSDGNISEGIPSMNGQQRSSEEIRLQTEGKRLLSKYPTLEKTENSIAF